MAAGLSVRVWTGSGAGTESAAVTGVDYISADNASNSLSNRQTYPITVGARSYEKWLALHVDTAPANDVSNFQVWMDGTMDTSTTMYFQGQYVTGATPTNGVSTVATTDMSSYTSGNKAAWDTNSYTATDATTQFLVQQLSVDATKGPGAMTQEIFSWSYDET